MQLFKKIKPFEPSRQKFPHFEPLIANPGSLFLASDVFLVIFRYV